MHQSQNRSQIVNFESFPTMNGTPRKRKKPVSTKEYGLLGFSKDNRGEKIRTSDPSHPIRVRYQTALRPEILHW